jgi:hypothetical protein
MVRLHGRSHWGGIRKLRHGGTGMLLKRTYTAYETRHSRWSVLVNGEIETHFEGQLSLVKFGP